MLALRAETARAEWAAKSRVKMFPGECEAHITLKYREKFISLVQALFALF